MRLIIRAQEGGHDTLRVQTNLRQIDPCLHPAAFAALASHLGYDPEPMAKAVGLLTGGEPPDPRYPALTYLISKARRDWERWGDKLVDQVVELLRNGELLPMSAKTEQALTELFRDHEVMVLARFTGTHPDHARLKRLIKRGLVSPDIAHTSYVDLSYRLAAGLDALKPHQVPDASEDAVREMLREALAYKPTARDKTALLYAKRQAGIFMRRPAQVFIAELDRVVQFNEEQRMLTGDELGAIRGAVSKSIRGEGSGDLRRDLKDAVQGNPTLVNDMQRVARTELTNAHGFGGYVKLKQETQALGIEDPWVYKFVSPMACHDCKRIWGLPGDPKRYRLSYIEEREAAGGNFRLPRTQWGPVRGAVHPNCTEGPLQYWNEALIESINKAAERFLAAQ